MSNLRNSPVALSNLRVKGHNKPMSERIKMEARVSKGSVLLFGSLGWPGFMLGSNYNQVLGGKP